MCFFYNYQMVVLIVVSHNIFYFLVKCVIFRELIQNWIVLLTQSENYHRGNVDYAWKWLIIAD